MTDCKSSSTWPILDVVRVGKTPSRVGIAKAALEMDASVHVSTVVCGMNPIPRFGLS